MYTSCVLRLNSSDKDGEPMYIQMVTALVLQLIQCVVHLPNDKDIFEECDKVGEQADAHAHVQFVQIQTHIQIYYLLRIPFLFLGGSRCVDNQLV